MTKRVVDLTAGELETLAGEAWSNAAQQALAKGLPVTGSESGRRVRRHPDGRVEDLARVRTRLPKGDRFQSGKKK
jgi:hypothetical protein